MLITDNVVALGLLLSLAIGATLGLFGGGGSILTVPVIHYVFGAGAHEAVAMSLAVVGVTSLIALIPQARAGQVEWRVGIVFGVSSMISAFVGARIGASLPGPFLMTAFAALMIVAGIAMLLRRGAPATSRVRLVRIIAVGLAVGIVTGTLGAGGGFVIVPALTLFGGLAMRQAVATSLFVIALNATAGVAGTLAHAQIDTRLTLVVAAFAMTGTFLGAHAAKRISTTRLQRGFGLFVIVVGLAVLVREVL